MDGNRDFIGTGHGPVSKKLAVKCKVLPTSFDKYRLGKKVGKKVQVNAIKKKVKGPFV